MYGKPQLSRDCPISISSGKQLDDLLFARYKFIHFRKGAWLVVLHGLGQGGGAKFILTWLLAFLERAQIDYLCWDEVLTKNQKSERDQPRVNRKVHRQKP